MTQKPIASVGPSVGHLKNVDDNFTELYAGAASANTALTTFAATQTAWGSYTATATAASGALTTAATTAAFIADGKTVHFRAVTIITTASAGATGSVSIDLPASANAATAVNGANNNGAALTGTIAAASKKVVVQLYDTSTPIASGRTITIAGTYEKQ